MTLFEGGSFVETPTTVQWRAVRVQMINWGGFHGHHDVEVSSAATLLSGASGMGKSTLLDAWLAVLMPGDVPFNGASNDNGGGRARGEEQRNLVSYLRGKLDTTTTADGRADKVMRGDGTPTWGALAVTFESDDNDTYTLARLYHVDRHVRLANDQGMRMVLVTVDGPVDLRHFEPAAAARFGNREVRAASPSATIHDTYTRFAAAFTTRLGIGTAGNGQRALRLLSRIQAGHQIRDVDTLYKQMVLDEPGTYEAADRAVAHFEKLEDTYEKMVSAEQQQETLSPIPDAWNRREEATRERHLIHALGVTGARSQWRRWEAETSVRVLSGRLGDVGVELAAAGETVDEAAGEEAEAELRLSDVRHRLAQAGGSDLARLQERLARGVVDRERIVGERTRFDDRTSALDVPITTRDEFVAAKEQAERTLSSMPDRQASLNDRISMLLRKEAPLRNEQQDLLEEHESLQGRDGRVPRRLHDIRMDIAQATGIDPSMLPFAAELMDVRSDEEGWRTAIEVTLGGIAPILLVDDTALDRVSEIIDDMRFRSRIRFQGVPVEPFIPRSGNQEMVSGKLDWKDHPFTHWVMNRVRADNADAACVDRPSDFGRSGARQEVTRAGQTRLGRSGAHGDSGHASIIGFSNETRLAEIAARIAALGAELRAVDTDVRAVRDELAALERQRTAWEEVHGRRWADIDVDGADQALLDTRKALEELTSGNEDLGRLQAEEEALRKEARAAARRHFEAEQHLEALTATQDTLTQAVEAHRTTAASLADVALADDTVGYLDSKLVIPAAVTPDTLRAAVLDVNRNLNLARAQANNAVEAADQVLRATFKEYQARWPNPNLGTEPDSYPDYQEILDAITAHGLPERRRDWVRSIASWSGEDLVPLNGAFDTAIEEIEERLGPINRILRTLPFGARDWRLQIRLRRLSSEDVASFRRELRALSSAATSDLSDDQIAHRFHQLKTFVDRIKRPAGNQSTRSRDDLLDVRRHVHVSAVAVDADGNEQATYDTLGGKSGGETQELVAFIVGSALRYQLGDEERDRPRFAPVLLDEAFVKADREFAGRAVQAWKGLGFQMIVAAPQDKVPALEPHVDQIVNVVKDQTKGYSYLHVLERK